MNNESLLAQRMSRRSLRRAVFRARHALTMASNMSHRPKSLSSLVVTDHASASGHLLSVFMPVDEHHHHTEYHNGTSMVYRTQNGEEAAFAQNGLL